MPLSESNASRMDEALEVLGSVPLIDGHNDWPHLIRGFYDNQLDERFDPNKNLVGHVDLKRLLQGKSGGAFWSVYVDCPESDDFSDNAAYFEIIRDTMQQIDLVHRLVRLYRKHTGLVKRASDIMALHREGRFASLIGVEGLHQIGVRYVTLAHNKNNLYADSATATTPAHDGLSVYGRDMVREMNRIGIIIDLSHTSEAVMRQTLDISAAPVIFSHSSIESIVPHVRNVPDSILEKLQQNNGVIMISFIPSLTTVDSVRATLDHIVDHIIHVAELIGYDHIGLGSDFDGMFSAVKGIDDVSQYPALILGLNIIRVLEQVETVSASCQDKLPVMVESIKQLWNDEFRATVRQHYPEAEHDIPRTEFTK
ncbi:membrane dipeptidase (Peptidase family m19) domain-containing protein [Trichoderma breve]|uniref:Dipeptidase n=1 Tax=Trichoderma breve TaxID=2034170 RepID=A0A9W9B528_9HYPO|nr:membrane dipeptidase (Peptidase family m19) domain-containing protein [Trichoderma breve]KAJ4854544.1 membrane dipeptidase (Peptidase family m19) domain-containing protein [Trichoderma breve]